MDPASGQAPPSAPTPPAHARGSAGCGCLAGALLGLGVAISVTVEGDRSTQLGVVALIVVTCAGVCAYLSRRYGERFWARLPAWFEFWW